MEDAEAMKEGQKAIVKANTTSHLFKIGEKVTLHNIEYEKEHDYFRFDACNSKGECWSLDLDDVELSTFPCYN